MQLDKEL